jgi:hypothetical protein
MNPLLDEAERLADLGVCAIPVRAGTKTAACRWGRFEAPANAGERRRLFSRPGVAGIAAVLGGPSGGLGCRDFDKAGAFEAWASREPALAAELPVSRTARGAHVYFMADGLDGVRSYSDGELRLGRAYTLIPPSVHPSGRPYQWVRRLDALPRRLDPFEAGLGESCNTGTQRHRDTSHKGGGGTASAQRCTATVIPADLLDAMISRTMPEHTGERNRRLFEFAREVRVHLPADTKPKELEPLARAWFERAKPVIGTKDLIVTITDFTRGFRKVRTPADAGFLSLAAERAAVAEPPAMLAAKYPGEAGLLMLAALCRELGRDAAGVFYLSSRDAGRIIGASHVTGWRFLELLTIEGLLERVDSGTQGAGGRAASFRWTGGDA